MKIIYILFLIEILFAYNPLNVLAQVSTECGTEPLASTEKELTPWYGKPEFLDSIKKSYGLGLETYQIQQLKNQE